MFKLLIESDNPSHGELVECNDRNTTKSCLHSRRAAVGSRKRKRIVQRLAQGLGRARKRRFFISNLVKSMNNFSKEAIQQQIKILITQSIVSAPTHKSVQLERTISEDAKTFLKMSCNYDENELTQLEIANGQLTD